MESFHGFPVSVLQTNDKTKNSQQRGGAGGNCVDFLLQYCEGGASFTRILCSVLYSVNFIKKPTKKCGRILSVFGQIRII